MNTHQGSLLKGLSSKPSLVGQGVDGKTWVQVNDEHFRGLLTKVDVIRDPVHGDIQLTSLERCLIDSPEFQRLRNLMQLGMTYIAYPGAVHTRFLHSLGTLHVCSQLIATCNERADTHSMVAPPAHHPAPLKITNYTNLLARLCALMHDMAHVPFGHTFDKEAKVFKKDEWQDKRRVDLVFGKDNDSGLTQRFREFFFREYPEIPIEVANVLLDDVRSVLMAKEESDIVSLPYPFVHDLVGNTVCADLIDYVKRDMYFCGLVESFGDRFLKYLAVLPMRVVKVGESHGERHWEFETIAEEKKEVFPTRGRVDKGNLQCCRIVLMNYRYNERKNPIIKHDVFEEAIDLVRRRLTVAEKLYYHRTKMVASAMLADAASEANIEMLDIWDKTDQEVLKDLARSPNERAQSLASKVLKRHLFKSIYRVPYHNQDGSEPCKKTLAAAKRFREPQARTELMKQLEKYICFIYPDKSQVAKGSFTMCCPQMDMSVKGFDMLVYSNPNESRIRSLENSDRIPTKLEIEAIKTSHFFLWGLEVFVDPDVLPLDGTDDDVVRKLIGAIEHEVGCPNENPLYKGCESIELSKLLSEAALEDAYRKMGKEAENMTHQAHKSLLAMSHQKGFVEMGPETILNIVREELRRLKEETS